ncbi:MAG: protein kinase, partial [Candidatus Bathyarchaeota archaeon]|nr:protein kinase [Candidatus Bathyarchaeota archaeon]
YDELEEAEGLIYLVLEYVPGQTLAERITKKPLKLQEALTIALQIAEAVAAAHEHDVIHRDLKPGNIKITEEGKVKVLDFGLAKVIGGEGMDQKTTITEPGRVIGTPAYMSPEQARGKPTDKRSDIWAFGCVFYEMLTANVPFKGETISDTLAAILEHEPNWQTLPESTPANIVALLRRCLEKEPRRRLRDVGDIAITIEDTTAELRRSTLPSKSVKAEPAQAAKWSRRALPWPITGAAVIILVLLGIIIGLKFGGAPEKKLGTPVSLPVVETIKAIVVLPFENLSGDTEQEYFEDGMTDELSTELGKIGALMVKGQYSAKRYKNIDKSIPEIAKELGVDAVIKGSVLKTGNDVRVIAQLVDGRTDALLWSDSYTGILTNILALQSEVTLAIAREIKTALTPEEQVRIERTEAVNPGAYEAFLKGRFFYFKFTEAGFKSAIDYLQQAIDIDPNYAEAHAWLSFAYWIPSIWGYSRPEESFPKARSAANKAMALDETLATAHVSVGYIALAYDWQWQKAKESFERGRELNPNDPEVYSGLGWYSAMAGRLDEALEMMQTTVKLDPLSPIYSTNLAFMYSLSGQIKKAIEQREKALELAPDFVLALDNLAEDYLHMSMYPEAVTTIERAMTLAGRTPQLVANLARAYAMSGKKQEAETLLQELQERNKSGYVSPIYFAEVYVSFGNKDEAIKWLEKAHQEQSYGMLFIRIWPFWDPLRSEPKFDQIIRRMNFPEAPVSGTAVEPIETAQAPIEKIAVLPFTSISSEAGEEWFVDGMTDALITQLGKIKALTVISRTSAMQYKNVSKPMPEIAQDLGVDALIEGSVIRAGNDVQITARLIDGRTDERVWGDFFQGTFSNILALQSQVTLAIAQEIETALTPDEQERIARTEAVNPEAYEAYLLGRHYLNKGLEPDIEVAIKYFKRALEIDSTYAIACTGLADAYTAFGNQNIRSPEDTWPNARTAAEKALAIDEGLAEAHTALAKVKYLFDWDWSSAEREFRLALEINPSSAGTHLGYSRFLEALERYDEALSQIERALELDPHSMIVKFFRCSILYRAGWKNEAIGLAKSEVDSDPDQASIWWYFLLANFYAGQGRYEEALALLQTQI